MRRGLSTLLAVSVLFLLAAATTPAQKPAGDYITIQDMEKVTGLTGLKVAPSDPSKGAGGDHNFADSAGNLVLMTQKMSGRTMYEGNKKMKSYVKGPVPGVGDEAFNGPPGDYPYFLFFLKGDTSVSLATYFGKGGKTRISMEKLIELAKLIASRI